MTSHYSPQSPEEEATLLNQALSLSAAEHASVEQARKAHLVITGKEGEVVVRDPGSINGRDFVINNCKQSRIFVLDHSNQAQVDDCKDCKLFIGPVDGSAFIRDCTNCKIAIACRQLRLRDCHNVELLLYCPTQPALELSDRIKIGCWNGAYPGLTRHFTAANLDPLHNTWNDVFDFTPVEGEPHWQRLEQTPGDWWEVPVVNDESGSGVLAPCENPVRGPEGAVYAAA